LTATFSFDNVYTDALILVFLSILSILFYLSKGT